MSAWFRRNRSDRARAGGNEAAAADVDADMRVDDRVAGAGAVGAGEPDGLLDRALSERRALVRLCLYALDRARSAGVAERIEEGLAAVGVTAVRPDGERFDPSRHEAGGTVPTDDPALDGVIAETEVVGFDDRGQQLRAPIVTVYTLRRTG